MSTIASPRDTSVTGRRIPLISTPTSSTRPSFEAPRSTDASPSRAPPQPARRNRAALREYYNLKATQPDEPSASSSASSIHDFQSSEVSESEMDSPSFNAEVYVKSILEGQTLAELLRSYNSVLTDIRALDAEKKALVYDNYSKLIAATETIRRMREGMDPLDGGARTLDLAIRGVWERAEGLREELRGSLGGDSNGEMIGNGDRGSDKRKGREVVLRVLETPERVRVLVEGGREEDAREMWGKTRLVLDRWVERGVGGSEVKDCINDGEAALKGEKAGEKSWVIIKARKEGKA